MRDTNKYVDVSCVQETKVKDVIIHETEGITIINFDTKNKHYENGFVAAEKWKNMMAK